MTDRAPYIAAIDEDDAAAVIGGVCLGTLWFALIPSPAGALPAQFVWFGMGVADIGAHLVASNPIPALALVVPVTAWGICVALAVRHGAPRVNPVLYHPYARVISVLCYACCAGRGGAVYRAGSLWTEPVRNRWLLA